MSSSAVSLGDRFCISRKGGTGGGGWVQRGECFVLQFVLAIIHNGRVAKKLRAITSGGHEKR